MQKKTLQKNIWIIQPYPHDWLTLSILIWSALSIGLALHQYFSLAIAVSFIALLSDALDGIIARKLKLERAFGKHLDSLIDVINYLITPSIIWYLMGFNGFLSIWLIIFVGCGCIRLAVFNEISTTQRNNKVTYLGMPVFWACFLLAFIYLLNIFLPQFWVFLILTILLIFYSFTMLYARPFIKITNPVQIVLVTLYGYLLFTCIHFFEIKDSEYKLHFTQALLIYLPPLIGGSLHMLIVSKNWLKPLATPISNKLFGAHKTWRGLLLMPLFSAMAGGFLQYFIDYATFNLSSGILIGFFAGMGYIIFELPNSFIKRRLNILPGQHAKKHKWLFIVMDQLDSNLGALIVLVIFLDISVLLCCYILILLPLLQLGTKLLLRLVKLKPGSL